MASRMAAAAVIAAFMVCALLTCAPAEAARAVEKKRGKQVAVAGRVNAAGDVQWEQQQDFIGHRPRLASFTRHDVAPPSVAGDAGANKREVPGGPDPIHHPGDSPSSPADP